MLINFAFSVLHSYSLCLSSHKYYFRAYSNYGKEIKKKNLWKISNSLRIW